jgi:hypothetical protein
MSKEMNVSSGSTGSISDVVNQVLNEQSEREPRKLNVVCYSLPESSKESHEERKNDDKNRIRNYESFGNRRLGKYEAYKIFSKLYWFETENFRQG